MGEAGKIFHDLKDYLDEVGTLETCLSVHVEMEKVELAVETTKQMVKVLQDTAHTQQYAVALHGLAGLQLKVCISELEEAKRDHPEFPAYHALEKEHLNEARNDCTESYRGLPGGGRYSWRGVSP